MGSLRWLAENWFTLLNALGVVGGLLFTGYSLRSETKTRRIANLLSLTQSHRDIWKQTFTHPQLSRVLDPSADTAGKPVTREEEIFVNLVIQHLSVVFHAMRDELTVKPEGCAAMSRSTFLCRFRPPCGANSKCYRTTTSSPTSRNAGIGNNRDMSKVTCDDA